MERIYCDCFCKWKSGIETDDYDPNATSVECTYRCCYDDWCMYKSKDIEEMKKEDVFCPFWDTNEAWIVIVKEE